MTDQPKPAKPKRPIAKRDARETNVAQEQAGRVIRTYDHRGRLRAEWWPATDAYLRVSYVDDGR